MIKVPNPINCDDTSGHISYAGAELWASNKAGRLPTYDEMRNWVKFVRKNEPLF